ncbi:glycine cleavage system protein GcvH [bacterium]|nr:glycine cleavage system protein GcvH [bacterium]
MVIEGLKYTKDHEWVRLLEGDVAEIGITDFAQDQLGDIVFVEVPEVGRVLAKGEALGVVESVKTVSDIFSPVSGEVIETNSKLHEDGDEFTPELINESPYEEGWILRVKMSDPQEYKELLDAESYKAITEEA